jgi:hypothetical protein
MTLSHTIPIIVTKQQVLDFANLTGDDSAIHVEGGIVQGGLILSMLPQWSKIAIELGNFSLIFNDSMTVKMDCKFSNPLIADTPVNITFNYTPLKFRISKISWEISGDMEYCSGDWIICSLS